MNGDYRDEIPLKVMDADAGIRLFDRQPPWMKELLWYSSLNLLLDVVAPLEPSQTMIDELRRLELDYADALHGPSYPSTSRGALPPPRRRRKRRL